MIQEKRLPLHKRTVLRKCIDNKRSYFVCKRIVDILFATTIIITVLSWLLPVLALLIKLTSKGPVFFLQKRTGRGGRSFTCYKLRTLAYNPSAQTKHTEIHEDLVTSLGWFLRQSNLDELPQFFNVLLGHMSVVGPRPHMHADCNTFSALIPGYKFRNLVKPGITGLAQVKGYHGRIISQDCIYKRFEWDAWYVQQAGMGLDIYIIYNTARQLVSFLVRGRKGNENAANVKRETANGNRQSAYAKASADKSAMVREVSGLANLESSTGGMQSAMVSEIPGLTNRTGTKN